MVSVALIILNDMFDEQIRNEEFLTENYNYSVLAVIQDLSAHSGDKGYYGYGYGYGSQYSKAAKGKQADG